MTTTTTPMLERNHPVTTAPARPTLYGPDGQALASTPDPTPAAVADTGDWRPVHQDSGTTVWERPRTEAAPEPVVDDAREQAEQIVADARAEADRLTAEARSLRARTLGSADHDARVIREQAAAEAARQEETGKRLDVWMARAVIAGAVGLTATGEYSLARLAHFPKEVAWLLPFVIDIYVIQAFRRHRDIVQAIGLTIAANVVYHLAAAGMFGVTTNAHGEHRATWWLIAMVASIASVILWRMHVMTAPPKEKKERRESGTEGHAQAVLGTPAKAVPVSSVDPVPAATQAGAGTGRDQLEHAPVPPASTASVPPASTAPVPASVPALRAVPEPGRRPVQRRRSTGPRTQKRAARSTAPKTGTGTASFEEHVAIARGWLKQEPGLSGTDIGKRLGTGDSYGRRVKRAAT